ncbi:hypothetical protein GLAREA_08054 [Glarea lozoyensis ATCC 20868]|uniref:Uncharacterized protein n=1 Tax=Glarea lozoyensis (strain ATCC 20868 / MF5171) TaxID=1116229 RepID=S3CG15_GLAL2|nr:uncharacterized protein GLAREA_08054 [Glarea lozoyensis ATCC 20868]EPE24204.1 hypothetical protein GLAREA_08054 [Glarea lozoyensis ATCC 20868]
MLRRRRPRVARDRWVFVGRDEGFWGVVVVVVIEGEGVDGVLMVVEGGAGGG